MVQCRVHCDSQIRSVDVDPVLGFEVLCMQLSSLFHEGREIENLSWGVLGVIDTGIIAVVDDASLTRCFLPDARTETVFVVASDLSVDSDSGLLFPWSSTCSRTIVGPSKKFIQPRFIVHASRKEVCWGCALACQQASGPVRLELANNVSSACQCDKCLFHVSDGSAVHAEAVEWDPKNPEDRLYQFELFSSLVLFRQRQLLPSEHFENYKRRLEAYSKQVLEYERPELQQRARDVMSLDKWRFPAEWQLDDCAAEKQRLGKLNRSSDYKWMHLLEDLMGWFKREFFSWVSQPPCVLCGGRTQPIGGARPSADESAYGAGIVEVYKCCGSKKNSAEGESSGASCGPCPEPTRFPRYNSAEKLLETRRGRCGEWAQCFTLCCRALGFDARFIVDWTDHVWTEVYLPDEGRWIHTDCCENIRDCPLVYEQGWKKKLSYVLAVSPYETRDVTRRYTKQWFHRDGPLSRRVGISETKLANVLDRWTRDRASRHPKGPQYVLERRQKETEFFSQLDDAELLQAEQELKKEELRTRISGNE